MISFALMTLASASDAIIAAPIAILSLLNDLFNAILEVLDLILGVRLN